MGKIKSNRSRGHGENEIFIKEIRKLKEENRSLKQQIKQLKRDIDDVQLDVEEKENGYFELENEVAVELESIKKKKACSKCGEKAMEEFVIESLNKTFERCTVCKYRKKL